MPKKKISFKNLFRPGRKKLSKEEDLENEDDFFDVDKLEIPKELAITQDKSWLGENYEGQLSVDVYQTAKQIVIKSTIAGVKPADLNIIINNDMITIRGKRELEEKIKEEDYLYQECYWGRFSRSIILPAEINPEKAKAVFKNGLLTITLPKMKESHTVKVREEE